MSTSTTTNHQPPPILPFHPPTPTNPTNPNSSHKKQQFLNPTPQIIMATTPPSSPPSPPQSPPTTHLLALPATSTHPHHSPPYPYPTLTPTPTPTPIPKKPQPLPWTHQETMTLIQTYQQKWYSLNKGQLKANQWEQVSSAIPTKTSTQCRHKMEKLRKRYRAERVKPYPNSWIYFQVMDHMERGPFPLNAQPVSAVKMLPQIKPHCPASNSSDFNSNDEEDDDSDEDDVRRSKSKSINNIVRGGMGVVYGSNNDGGSGGNSSVYGRNMKIPIVGGSERGGMMPNVMMNSKKRRGRGYDEDSDDDEEDVDVDVDGEGDDDVVDGDGGKELASEIKGFAERFMRVEKMKLEMMRETERYRMDMEKRRLEMIMNSHRKIVDTIGRAFRAHKKLNTGDEV